MTKIAENKYKGFEILMELSIRLETILQYVQPAACIADIGTDHGYLPIELVRRGICQRALACDVRRGPLQRAKEHICQAGLEEKVETRLSNGLSEIRPGEVNGVVIAGMGGMLIQQILQEDAQGAQVLKGLSQLIVQPQSDWAAVRRELHRQSFCIIEEAFVEDRGKPYILMACCPGKQSFTQTWQYTYGLYLAEKKDAAWIHYLEKAQKKSWELREELRHNESIAAQRRCAEIEREMAEREEVLKICKR